VRRGVRSGRSGRQVAREKERVIVREERRRFSRGTVFVGWVGWVVGRMDGWGRAAARGEPLSGKSAGVRTEMLRDRVGRGCPLTT